MVPDGDHGCFLFFGEEEKERFSFRKEAKVISPFLRREEKK